MINKRLRSTTRALTFALIALVSSACALQKHDAINLPPISPRSDTELFIYAGGEFKRGGRIPWTNGMRLKDAIELAGGFTDFWQRGIVLRHGDGTGEYYPLTRKTALKDDRTLMPGDTVFALTPDGSIRIGHGF
jgi:protein involved in polysaccharide export with SLBB domain